MVLPTDGNSTESVGAFLNQLRSKGVKLWMDGGRVRYVAPKGALRPEDLSAIRGLGNDIGDFLESAEVAQISCPTTAPLAYSQLAHWNLYRLADRPSFCQILSLTRLQGPLAIDLLQKSLSEVVRRHETLRTRVVLKDGIPFQDICDACDCSITLTDLNPDSQRLSETEASALVEQIAIEPINVISGPLFRVRLLKLHEQDHILFVAIEHLIADGYSIGILLHDLFTAYEQVRREQPISWQRLPLRFADYARRQADEESLWLKKHEAYWAQRKNEYQRLPFPSDTLQVLADAHGWDAVPVRIDTVLKAALSEWSRQKKTTLVLAVFTAYIALVLRWCGVTRGVFPYQVNGRNSPKIENLIGYFASVIYVPIDLHSDDTFVTLLHRVIRGYCEAHEHADSSYLEAQSPRPEFTRNTCFNWITQGLDLDAVEERDSTNKQPTRSRFLATPDLLHQIDRDLEPTVLLFEQGNTILGNVQFPTNRVSRSTMIRFARNFLSFLEVLVKSPHQRVSQIGLLS